MVYEFKNWFGASVIGQARMRDFAQAQQNKCFPTYNSSCLTNALCCCRHEDDLPIQPPHGDLCRHGRAQKFNKDKPTSSLGIRCKHIPKTRHNPGCTSAITVVLFGCRVTLSYPGFWGAGLPQPCDLKHTKGIWAQKLGFIKTETGFFFFNRQRKKKPRWNCSMVVCNPMFPISMVFSESRSCFSQTTNA